MLNAAQKNMMTSVYRDCADEAEREETVQDFVAHFNVAEWEIRHALQDANVYKKQVGKTEKEQYAAALAAVTGISAKEFLKLSLKAQIKLMDVFRGK
jgi:hypothetical protein